MSNFVNNVKRFLKSEDGPTATEYAVMLALIIVACIATVQTLGGSVEAIFSDVDQQLQAM